MEIYTLVFTKCVLSSSTLYLDMNMDGIWILNVDTYMKVNMKFDKVWYPLGFLALDSELRVSIMICNCYVL